MDLRSTLRNTGRTLRSLATNGYFWAGIGALLLVGAILYVLLNFLIMPSYTRHDTAIVVPDVLNQPYTEAARILEGQDLRVERVVQRFNPNLPKDVVVDQNPGPEAHVKPNRRIYLTVNSGSTPMVTVPALEGISLRDAMNRLSAVGLRVGETIPDSIPHPYANTITRQDPAPGDSLAEGAPVALWYSTGYGERFIEVPDVTGLTLSEARDVLLENRLRSVVVGGTTDEAETESMPVVRQGREPGSFVREGFEIRLFLEDSDSLSTDPDVDGIEPDLPTEEELDIPPYPEEGEFEESEEVTEEPLEQ